jgi:hypothetical protein
MDGQQIGRAKTTEHFREQCRKYWVMEYQPHKPMRQRG